MRWRIFGIGVVQLAAALLAVCVSAAAPAQADQAYQLGDGDVVQLTVYQRPDLSLESVRLGANGRMYVPGGGKVDLGGLTVAEAESQISSLLAHSGAARNPQVDLQVVTFGSQKVSVFGYVNTPGSYVLDRPTRLSELLAQAGGIDPQGSDHIILLRHSGSSGDTVTRTVVDMRAVINAGTPGADPEVKGGDIVNVPHAPRVYVYGAVNSPGAYKLEEGMTPIEAIALAGGVSQNGSDSRLEVVRHVAGGKSKTLKVKLEGKLQAEDVLIVHESIF
jgi:polysaccharide export outer membrane protein